MLNVSGSRISWSFILEIPILEGEGLEETVYPIWNILRSAYFEWMAEVASHRSFKASQLTIGNFKLAIGHFLQFLLDLV